VSFVEKKKTKTNLLTLRALKERGEKAVFLTAYDYPLASLADKAGVDIILVGDSLGMTTYGCRNTLTVTMDDMVRHSQAVTRAASRAFVVGDLPFMSYQPSDRDAVLNAGRLIAEGGCDAVKCEGGARVAARVKAMTDAGVVVMGHLGLTPQNQAQLGGYRVQGKTPEAAQVLVDDAAALEEAGASLLLLEAMPPDVAAAVRDSVAIPVYGIGAGGGVDGQLVIVHDIIGLFDQFTPKFVKRYCDAGALIEGALKEYCADVRSGAFPGPEHFYSAAVETKKTGNSAGR
jgi:3-methyl-2-oxobutanoate hydroxymethyltransferase